MRSYFINTNLHFKKSGGKYIYKTKRLDVKEILAAKNIKDVEKFTNPSIEDVHHFSRLKNMDKGIELLLSHIHSKNNIFIQVDSDLDGYTSAAVLIKYLMDTFPQINITWGLQKGKEHGIIIDQIPSEAKLVIAPDSGSSDYLIHEQLANNGIDVLVIDHHFAEKESEHAVIINNQLSPNYPNKNISGAGVVLKFCEALDEALDQKHAHKFLDLVALGNIADMIDLREPETRYYSYKGLNSIRNALLSRLIEKQSYSLQGKVNFTSISYFIAPLFNACIRVGTHEDKQDLMHGLLGINKKIFYEKKGIYEDLVESLSRRLSNIRSRQNRLKDKLIEEVILRNEESGILKDNIIIFTHGNPEYKNIAGLAANYFHQEYGKPVLVLFKEGDKYYGSARGETKTIPNFLKYLTRTELFEKCQGHPNAFGVAINSVNLKTFREIVSSENQELSKYKNDHYELDNKDLSKETVAEIASFENHWCCRAEEPTFLIKDILINCKEIEILGSRAKTIKFGKKGIQFVKNSCKKTEIENMSRHENYVIDVVCKFRNNVWRDEKHPFVHVEEIIIKEAFLF